LQDLISPLRQLIAAPSSLKEPLPKNTTIKKNHHPGAREELPELRMMFILYLFTFATARTFFRENAFFQNFFQLPDQTLGNLGLPQEKPGRLLGSVDTQEINLHYFVIRS
jgi:hypothetical protein